MILSITSSAQSNSTPENPYPTLFDYNNYKTTATPRKTKKKIQQKKQ
jgi:hypothetical protein